MREKKTGKFLRVGEARAKMAKGEELIEVWEKDPNTSAFADLIRRALRAEADVTALREAFRAGFMAHLVAPDPAETDPLKILDERNRWRFDGNQIAGDKEPMAFEAWTRQSAALTATEDTPHE